MSRVRESQFRDKTVYMDKRSTCGQCSIYWGNACLPSHELHIDYELINKCVRVFLVVSKIPVENLEE